MTKLYHYTESGLDNIYLANGFTWHKTAYGKGVSFSHTDELHEAIGRDIISNTKKLSGREFRYLRIELLMSQSSLAQLLQVRELTVARWEKGHTKIPLAADATIRLLYQEHIGGNQKISDLLHSIADLEDRKDRMVMEETADGWSRAA